MQTDCLIIHLERAHARLPQVREMMDMVPLPAHIVAAVDGQNMSRAQSQAYRPRRLRPRYPFHLRPSEVATFHSHRACWRKIIDDGLEAALILEDDLHLDPEIFPKALDLALSHAQQGELVRFPIKMRETALRDIASNGEVHLKSYDSVALGMVAQLVTRNAAQALLAATETFDRPVDSFLQMQWVHQVPVRTIWPCGVREISNELGGSLITRKSGPVERLRREVLRPLYRRKIKALSKAYLHDAE
ncbi:glycosyltransferase family 25 protein [Roseovarius sp. LXJ103]|uniref:glycosyltransferase family 25 protein n=1 Tax=Roseovarius carneus TaxID=2853164 RepID=UPI0015E7E5D7|nr:glycosyltransferase family 25 protein [Roseovarius carneus]MBZ8118359.1 glycosyltransferase family 25 protein [Roseovarius carneus]